MSNKINEGLMQLSELIRQLNGTIMPEDDWHYLYHKDIRDRLYGEKPGCFIALKRKDGGVMGRDVEPYLLPICNRAGIEDPKVISISIKLVRRLMDEEDQRYDINDLQKILNRLQHSYNVYSKEVPHPPGAAAKKALVTKMFNKIRQHLDRNRTA
jgi:hypothetical protein